MGRRMTPLMIIGLVFSALALGSYLYQFQQAQRLAVVASQPSFWLLGFSVIVSVVLYSTYEVMISSKGQDTSALSAAHDSQIDKLITESGRLDELNTTYCETIESLEKELDELKNANAQQLTVHTEEKSVLNQQIVTAVQGQVEANTRQMEALNLAMQYQRGELKELRHQLRDTQTRVSDMLRIDSPHDQHSLPSVATTTIPVEDEALTSWRVRL